MQGASKMEKKNAVIRLISIPVMILITVISLYIFREQLTSQEIQKVSAEHPAKLHTGGFKTFSSSITISAVGDILIHSTVYKDAKTANGYNFKPMFAAVKPLLEKSDITIANQESMIGGAELGLSTYPSFNSPYEVADALKDAGIDIVSIANNHTLDRGEEAILNATNYYNKIGLLYVGSYQNPEDRNNIRVISRNGIKVSFLSYTYGTNGIPVPEGKDYLVNLINMDQIKKDIMEAKEISDCVVVNMHWGNEYERIPTNLQKQMAKELAETGAHLILGHHPHVLQPMEWIIRKDGGKSFVIYSLGNFLSGQVGNYKDIGGVLTVQIKKEWSQEGKEEVFIENPQFIPTYVVNKHLKQFRVVPLKSAKSYGLTNADKTYIEIQKHMEQWLQ
jgi:poly-gamma-glutamate capsule biosynthesis protein CapA/YwtB (metallophosphatase superfamily)